MLISWFLASLIAFPKEGQNLPFLERCYMSGAVDAGTTNVVVQGRNVSVHPLGGWVTMIDVAEGTNQIEVAGVRRTFIVAKRPVPKKGPAVRPAKPYAKLPYAGDKPKARPIGKSPSEITIVIDAGHGGTETGALSPHNLREADLNLVLAKNVRDALVKLGFRVVMTRESDVTVPLYDRPKVAHAQNADAFVSIHHNAPPLDRDPRGIRYHAVYAWNEIGAELARAVNVRMGAAFGETLRNNGVMNAAFAVTRNPEIPSCLIETDFLTSPEGEVDCWNRSRRLKIAAAIAQGIADWCQSPVAE